jgi:hypothetical protein
VRLGKHRENFAEGCADARDRARLATTVNRRVKGTLFVDYVRMLRAHKGVDYATYLFPEDLEYLLSRIEPNDWYPMKSFERMGIAILAEIAHGDLETVRQFGRISIDWLCQQHPNLLAPGDPPTTLMRFQVLRRTFFDYAALELTSLCDGEAAVCVSYEMGAVAEEAATWQTMGFFERLLEVAGAQAVRAWLSSRSWAGDARTLIQLRWTPPHA